MRCQSSKFASDERNEIRRNQSERESICAGGELAIPAGTKWHKYIIEWRMLNQNAASTMSIMGIADSTTVERPLTERMRNATRQSHDNSDKLVNLKLSFVITSKPLYAEAISLFWPIFLELEALLEEHKNHEQLKLLHPMLNILRRAPSFEDDFRSLLGSEILVREVMQRRIWMLPGQSKQYSPPVLQAYIDRLRHLSKERPIVLVAYVYHMYSAILAGGTIIKRIVKMTYGLKSDDGVQIFVLPYNDDFTNSKVVHNKLKHVVNHEMQLSEDHKQQIIDESLQVFLLNNALAATVKDSDVFAVTFRRCVRNMGAVFLAIGAICVLFFVFYGRK